MPKMPILEDWQQESGSQGFQSSFENPLRYSQVTVLEKYVI